MHSDSVCSYLEMGNDHALILCAAVSVRAAGEEAGQAAAAGEPGGRAALQPAQRRPHSRGDGRAGQGPHLLPGQGHSQVRAPGVRWSAGPLVRWSAGPLVHWSTGPLVHWSAGPLVHWSTGCSMAEGRKPAGRQQTSTHTGTRS